MKHVSPQAGPTWSRSLLCLGAATALLSILAFLLLVPGGPYLGATDHPAIRSVTSWVGLGMAVVGLAWLVHIYRRDPEASPSRWRLYTPREWGRDLFYLGAATALLTIILFVFTVDVDPHFGAAEIASPVAGTRWIALGMAVLGLAWLVRIYRPVRDPEAGPSPWRFHEWD